jgi:hypothetical protein
VGTPPTQIDDMNPGINPHPDGLFWTMALPDDSVTVNPGAGRAIYRASDLQVADYGTIDNAFSGLEGVPATVSFEERWSGIDQRLSIKDRDARFGGEFVRGSAQKAWSAVVGDFLFESDPLETSSSDFASLGTERNGAFFPRS